MKGAFDNEKKLFLSKPDKSLRGRIDSRMIPLVEKINSIYDYYTTSSCSGRIALYRPGRKRSGFTFLKVWHNKVKILPQIEEKELWLKMEGAILHVKCSDLESAEMFLEKARTLGWKRSGIISLKKHIILELISTENLAVPLTLKNKSVISEEGMKMVLEQCNSLLEKTWKKINGLLVVI